MGLPEVGVWVADVPELTQSSASAPGVVVLPEEIDELGSLDVLLGSLEVLLASDVGLAVEWVLDPLWSSS